MPKLIDLKDWLSARDAARYLSSVFGEEVQEADVLRLGLDGRLKLSVHFVNHAQARPCEIVSFDKVVWRESMFDRPGATPGDKRPMIPDCDPIDEDRWLRIGDEVVTLADVWDLVMLGTERLDVEHAYQTLTGGPAVTLEGLDGAFVEAQGKLWQIQENYDNNPYQSGSTAQLERIKESIARNDIDSEKANELLAKHSEARKEFLERQRSGPRCENYYPSSLPSDSVFVVRTTALRQLEDEVRGAQEKPLGTSERRSLQLLFAAMAKQAGFNLDQRGIAAAIAAATESTGAPITDDTVRRYVAETLDALDARKK